jgi:RNA polymerase sigma-70 factor (ECF subfamily)
LRRQINGEATLTQKQLISRILEGERKLFHELVRPYERAVFVTANAVLRNYADAEEAAQETMLKALKHLNQLEDPAKFKAWLLHIALNEARLKRRSRHDARFESLDQPVEHDDGFMPRDFADWHEIPSETLERKEIRQAIARALEGLPEIYREIFMLRDVQELSILECCEMLQVSEEAVKVRLHRARLMIREKLAPTFRKGWLNRLLPLRGIKPW